MNIQQHTFASVTKYWFDAPRIPPLIILRDAMDANPLVFQDQINIHVDFLAVYVVQHGRGKHVINGVPYAMVRGDVYLMGLGAEHQYSECSELEIDALYFPLSLLDEESLVILRRQPILQPFLTLGAESGRWKHLSPVNFDHVNTELVELKQAWASATEIGGLLTRVLFLRLLIHLAQQTDAFDRRSDSNAARPRDSADEAIARAVQLMEAGFTESIHVEQVAQSVHMSPDWFTKVFERVTGQSPRDYLRALRLDRAKALLMTTSFSVTEIALASGFGDSAYFARVFREETGNTPSHFRSQRRGP